jgi:heme A synthase
MLTAIASWVIYGWILWTSDEKEACEDEKDTRIAAIFMLIFCIFGICVIIFAVVALIAVPYCYCTVLKPAIDDPGRAKDATVSYKVSGYVDPSHMKDAALFAEECKICLDGYAVDN